MKLVRFMDAAYQGKASGRKLKTRQGDMIFSLEDLADQVGMKPSRAEVEQFVPQDKNQLDLLISEDPGKKYSLLWGDLTSLAAERSTTPLLTTLPGLCGPGTHAGHHHHARGRGPRGRENERRQDPRARERGRLPGPSYERRQNYSQGKGGHEGGMAQEGRTFNGGKLWARGGG
jgi:hypothetical protein